LLTGCGGPKLPAAAPAAMPQNRTVAGHGGSWMARDATRLRRLLYVSDLSDNNVYVWSLPEGRLVGTLTGNDGPTGECSDSAGDVFVTDFFIKQIREYRHGAKSPAAILNDPNYTPLDCAVDPTTGNLAVTNEGPYGPGNVAIYAHAKGKPAYYTGSNISQYGFDSYDQAGNLYADGSPPSSGNIAFAMLPKGSGTFESLNLNSTFCCNSPGLQWDGTHLVVASLTTAKLYQFAISGNSGTLVGSTKLAGSSHVQQFWIQNKQLYAPVITNSVPMVRFYAYPAGGKPTKTLLGFLGPYGTTVSLRP